MREIKFRAYDKREKRMWYNVQDAYDTLVCHHSGDQKYSDCKLCFDDNPGFISFKEVLQDENLIKMQYTGLEDKHKKEVFFDDIIQFSFDDDEIDEHYSGTALVVESMNGGAAILHDWDDDAMELVAVLEGGEIEDIWPDEIHWEFEVIGNRWENPELLKT